MFIEQISGQYIKIKFDINEKQLLLGDILKITASGKNGVLVQVTGISTVEKNPNFNLAESKILFTIESSGKLISWQGNIPSQEFMVKRLTSKEVLTCSSALNPLNPVPLGVLSLYPDTEVQLESTYFENTTVIYCDKQTQKDNILNILACELSKNHEKTVLIDFNGDYTDLKVSSVLEAGKDIKLPFDIKGLDLLYNKCLTGVSPETRATVEDIFTEIENYLSSGEIESIPFEGFIQAVSSVYETNKIPELVLLKNKLLKLQKHGIFADRKHEIINFSENVKNNALVIVDLSKFPQDWQKELIEFLIDSNTKKYKQNFFLLMDSDKICADKHFTEKLCGKGNKNGINPVIISGHESESAVSFLSYAKNTIAFAPENMTKIAALKDNLVRLKDHEAVVSGKITNNVPLYINIYDLEVTERSCCSDNSDFAVQASPEIYLDIDSDSENEEPIKTDDCNFNYSNQFAYDEAGIELIDNISKLQEEVSFAQEQNIEEEDFSVTQQETMYDDDEDNEEFDSPEQTLYDDDDDDNVSPQQTLYDDDEEGDYASPQQTLYDDDEDDDYASPQQTLYDDDDDEDPYAPAKSTFYDDDEDNYTPSSTSSSFYDAVENESHYQHTPSMNDDSDFSENDLSGFYDDDDDEENSNMPEEEGDDDFDYDSSEDFQDDSILDYASTGQQDYGSFYDDEDDAPGNNTNSSDDYGSFYDDDEDAPADNSDPSDDYGSFYDDDEAEEEEVVQKPQSSSGKIKPTGQSMPDIPIYSTPKNPDDLSGADEFQEGDKVSHEKYGLGVVTKIIGSNEKRLCSIQFDDVGRRLLDPKLAGLEKIS